VSCSAHVREKHFEEVERNEVAFGRPHRGHGAGRGGHAWRYAPCDEPGAEARNSTSPRSGVTAKLPTGYYSLCPSGDSGGYHEHAVAEARTTPSSGAKYPTGYYSLCPSSDSGRYHADALAEARRRKHTVAQPERLDCDRARAAIEQGTPTRGNRGEFGPGTEPPLRSRRPVGHIAGLSGRVPPEKISRPSRVEVVTLATYQGDIFLSRGLITTHRSAPRPRITGGRPPARLHERASRSHRTFPGPRSPTDFAGPKA
jgi:hypothetical protein